MKHDKMVKKKKKELLKTIYQASVDLIMFTWVAAIILLFTNVYGDALQELHLIFKIGYVLGSINLLILSLTKNWSVLK